MSHISNFDADVENERMIATPAPEQVIEIADKHHFSECFIHPHFVESYFFVKFISFLKIWDSLTGPQASMSEKHNNYNYCQLGLTFGCLLHWVHW